MMPKACKNQGCVSYPAIGICHLGGGGAWCRWSEFLRRFLKELVFLPLLQKLQKRSYGVLFKGVGTYHIFFKHFQIPDFLNLGGREVTEYL